MIEFEKRIVRLMFACRLSFGSCGLSPVRATPQKKAQQLQQLPARPMENYVVLEALGAGKYGQVKEVEDRATWLKPQQL